MEVGPRLDALKLTTPYSYTEVVLVGKDKDRLGPLGYNFHHNREAMENWKVLALPSVWACFPPPDNSSHVFLYILEGF